MGLGSGNDRFVIAFTLISFDLVCFFQASCLFRFLSELKASGSCAARKTCRRCVGCNNMLMACRGMSVSVHAVDSFDRNRSS